MTSLIATSEDVRLLHPPVLIAAAENNGGGKQDGQRNREELHVDVVRGGRRLNGRRWRRSTLNRGDFFLEAELATVVCAGEVIMMKNRQAWLESTVFNY